MSGFAVVDVETTGFSPRLGDRVVEIAIVHLDAAGAVTGRWETLLNPDRDLGPQHVHGIRAADVLDAPRFVDVASELATLLSGRVIVAHNAAFDLRFLRAEFERAGVVVPDELATLCTMQLAREFIPGAGRSLADCCAAFAIEIDGAHRALADADATAALVAGYLSTGHAVDLWATQLALAAALIWGLSSGPSSGPSRAESAQPSAATRWHPRPVGSGGGESSAFWQRVTERLPDFSGPDAHLDYLALLDRCLLDRVVSTHEARELVALAEELGIGRATCVALHDRYFDDLVGAAWADGVLTPDELADLGTVAVLLQISDERMRAAHDGERWRAAGGGTAPPGAAASAGAGSGAGALHASATTASARPVFALEPGDMIVLTGTMTRSRDAIEAEIIAAGFLAGTGVSRRTKLLVAADPDSLSGKAKSARKLGIPVIGEHGLAPLLAR
jgi:DNA polymerase III subunit epsilon